MELPIKLFPNGAIQIQKDSIAALIASMAKHGVTDKHQQAYVFATCYHESRLKPIEEIGKGKGHSYGIPDPVTHQIYYGRGFCQITHKGNYATFGKLLKIDLVNHPELALVTSNAAEICVLGMRDGMFTGVGLKKYFTGVKNDPVNARKIINSLDRANLIAAYYLEFLNAIGKIS